MLDDISFIPNSISIMSRMKSNLVRQENSISRIIREQPPLYSNEVPD